MRPTPKAQGMGAITHPGAADRQCVWRGAQKGSHLHLRHFAEAEPGPEPPRISAGLDPSLSLAPHPLLAFDNASDVCAASPSDTALDQLFAFPTAFAVSLPTSSRSQGHVVAARCVTMLSWRRSEPRSDSRGADPCFATQLPLVVCEGLR